jgi:hypothetical protein
VGGAQERGKRRRARDGTAESAALGRPRRSHARAPVRPECPSTGPEESTSAARHSAPQFPLHPYTGRLKIAKALPHAELLARELMNFRSRVTAQTVEAQLDWRERANDDLVLALAIATWQAERDPGLGFSCSYGVSEMDGWGGI